MDNRILMADIIPLLPLPHPPHGKSDYYVPCPHCDDGHSRKHGRHLNISFTKNVFRCVLCDWKGGIFDLYAYYANIPRNKVRNELMRILRKSDSPSGLTKKSPAKTVKSAQAEIIGSPLADIDIRHAAYSALLSMLYLAPDHKANLLNRGLSERAVTENGYKTSPRSGSHIIAGVLNKLGIQTEGVPGFYKDNTGAWALIMQSRGILVPVRDIRGRIQGLQIRLDDMNKRKYRWVSSAGSACGCGAEGWIHLAGPVGKQIILIEGPMKADIVCHLTGRTVLAVPGVNSLKHLEPVLRVLKTCGVIRIMTAFDMDFVKNPHVQNGYTELVSLLDRMNFRFGTYLWQPEFNGLDDYVRECCRGYGQNE